MLLQCKGIHKEYEGCEILSGIDFEAAPGQITVLIGPNGAGKTTLLKILSLLEPADRGIILFDGKETAFGNRDARRNAVIVFQQPLLLDRTVEANIMFGLKVRRINGYRSKMDAVIDLLGLEEVRHRHTSTLSGGEKRRTMLGMAMVLNPPILLLDESFSNLDPLSVRIVESALLTLKRTGKVAVIMATHSLVRAESHGDVIYFMKKGKIVQHGTPAEIFQNPHSLYTADYTGQKNIFHAAIDTINGDTVAELESGMRLSVVTPLRGKVCVIIPPTDILISLQPFSSSALNTVKGTVTGLGSHGPLVTVEVNAGVFLEIVVTKRSAEELSLAPGKEVFLTWKASSVHVFKEEKDA